MKLAERKNKSCLFWGALITIHLHGILSSPLPGTFAAPAMYLISSV